MKKLISALVCLSMSIVLVACTSNNKDKPQDNAFIKDTKKAVDARWNYLNDVNSGKIVIDDEKVMLGDAVKKELDILAKYKDAKFDNLELGKLANDYVLALENQQDSLKYYDSDYGKYEKLWKEGYDSRSTILVTLVEKFGLKLDEKQFKDLKTNAQVVKENNEFQAKIDDMLKNIKFEKVKDEYGWRDYEAIVENTSGADLDGFYLNIDLIDKDGVVIETTMASHNGIWKDGQKYKLTFSTDKSFEKMEWNAEYYISE